MKARQLIEGAAAYGPEQVNMIPQAFEQVGTRIEHRLYGQNRWRTRVKLARAVLRL